MFSVARGQVLRRIKSTALSLRPSLHTELTFPSFADAVSFFGLWNPAWLARASTLRPIKVHTIFRDGHGIRERLKNKAIFDSQENERNALPNFRPWLTTSSRVITLLIDGAGRNHFETLVMFMNYEKLRHLTNQSNILHTNIIYANLWIKIIFEIQMLNHVIFEWMGRDFKTMECF